MQHKIFIRKGLTVNNPFFYIVKHKASNKLYAGYCSCKRHCDSEKFMTISGYKTSSKIVKDIISNEGIDSFIIERIRHFENSESALYYESKFLKKVDAKNNPLFINQNNSGKNFKGGSNITKETLEKRSMKISGMVFWNNGQINKRSKECPGDGWFRGKFLNDISKKNVSDSQIGFKRWTNGIENKKSKECPGDGWILGTVRTDEQIKIRKEINLGRKWWNNGIKNKSSKECPGDGWVIGKLMAEDERSRRVESIKGRKYWNNGEITIRAWDCPGDNWKMGIHMTPEQKMININKSKGKKRWNNGVIEKKFSVDQTPPIGWVKGGLTHQQRLNIAKVLNT